MKTIKIGYDPHISKDIKKLVFEKAPDKTIFSSQDVLFGNHNSNIAICFVYNWKSDKPPKEIHDLFVKLSNYAVVTGYWRTTNGGKYAFANILSNPNINKLVVLVFGSRDNGHLLVDALVNLWKNGVDKDGIIAGCRAPNPKFEGISNRALARLTAQADLVVLRGITDLSLPEQVVKAQIQEPENAVPAAAFKGLEFYSNLKLCSDPAFCSPHSSAGLMYDGGCRFEEPMIIDFSSATEEVTFNKGKNVLSQSIEVDDLEQAAEQVAAFIFQHGDMNRDQRGIITAEYRSFSLTVKDSLSKIPSCFSKEYITKYVKEFMEGVGEGLDDFAYTYHERIFKRWGNQAERAVRLLKQNPNTRRVLISLWDHSAAVLKPRVEAWGNWAAVRFDQERFKWAGERFSPEALPEFF